MSNTKEYLKTILEINYPPIKDSLWWEEILSLIPDTKAYEPEQFRQDVSEYTPERAQYLINIRDALVYRDINEAYHWLSKLYNPPLDKLSHEVWKDVEEIAAKGDFEKYHPPLPIKPQSFSSGGVNP